MGTRRLGPQEIHATDVRVSDISAWLRTANLQRGRAHSGASRVANISYNSAQSRRAQMASKDSASGESGSGAAA